MNAFSPYQIPPGSTLKLSEVDPDDKSQFNVSKKEGVKMLPKATERLVGLHRLLYAQGKHRVLVVVQTIDAGGKDGTIREVFAPLDPMHFHVASFKAPSSLETKPRLSLADSPKIAAPGRNCRFQSQSLRRHRCREGSRHLSENSLGETL